MSAILSILICPAVMLAATLLLRRPAQVTRASAALMWVQMAVAAVEFGPYLGVSGPAAKVRHGFVLDGTAALFVILTTLVMVSSLTHAIGFFEREASTEHPPTLRAIRTFYLFVALFLVSMYAVVLADNLGFLWIAVEATTLLSAPLVYYHRSETSLEATWKYLIICSVGIAFAFFGTAIFFAASQRVAILAEGSLSITALTTGAMLLPHGLLRLGFIFTLLGYGTKAGLFPLHSWLPDAHSEAPAPASAMLSGALLNCALVGLMRTSGMMVAAGEARFVNATLLPMGIATVVAAALFLIRQQDIKRMLAYSSMENVGLMAVAIALGSSAGFGLQAINHSVVKVALFLLAGNLLQQFGTKSIRDLRGVLSTRAEQGLLLLVGVIAVAGTPPFGSFIAEWQILTAAADSGHALTVIALCAALAIAFIALVIQAASIVFGQSELGEQADAQKPSFASLSLVPWILVAASLVLGVTLSPSVLALVQGAPK